MAYTSDIRPMPNIRIPGGFVLCRERQACRFGAKCTFAHSVQECRAWNAQKFGHSTSVGHVPIQISGLNTRHPRMPLRQSQPSDSRCHTLRECDYAAKKTDFLERLEESLTITDIERPLTRENYKEKFHKLLCWEEKTHIEILEERCNGYYQATLYEVESEPHWLNNAGRYCHRRFGCLLDMTGDQIAYATQASEAAVIVQFPEEIKADILRGSFQHTDENLYIAFNGKNAALLQKYLGNHHIQQFDVQFEVKHSYFNNLHRAIEGLSHDVIAAKIVPIDESFITFPHSPTSRFSSGILKLEDYSHDQLAALKLITSCPAGVPPVLITGAFGTGKTRLLASAAYCILEHAQISGQTVRILVCAHHQASADAFLECYCELANPQHPWSVHLTRLTSSDFYRIRNSDYKHWYKTVSQFEMSVQYYRQLLTITTCLTSLRLVDLLPRGYYTHIFVDEGAQAREPELVAPLGLATKDTRIVIAGDHCQVGPALLVLGEEARENGLKSSLLERLWRFYKMLPSHISSNYCATLVTNYRCHREILELPAKLFYPDSTLECKVPATTTHPSARYPLLFVCSSLDENVQSINSVVNENEAKILIEQVSYFVKKWPHSWGGNDFIHKVGIVTQTRSQIVLTRHLTKRLEHLYGVRMLPTYDIQGQEFYALFLSTSEPIKEDGETCNPTKSVCDRYVFNTVITRARCLIVSVGNPFILLKTEKHMIKKYGETGRCWSEYIKLCLQHDTLDVSIEPSQSKQRRFLERLRELVCRPVKSASNSSNHPQLQSPNPKQHVETYPPVPLQASGLQRADMQVPHTAIQRVVSTAEHTGLNRASPIKIPHHHTIRIEEPKKFNTAPSIQQTQKLQEPLIADESCVYPGTKVTPKPLQVASSYHPQLKPSTSKPDHSIQKAKLSISSLNDPKRTRTKECSVDQKSSPFNPNEFSRHDPIRMEEPKKVNTAVIAPSIQQRQKLQEPFIAVESCVYPGTKVTPKPLQNASGNDLQLRSSASKPGHSIQKAKLSTSPLNDPKRTRTKKCSVDQKSSLFNPNEFPSLVDAAKVKVSKKSKARNAAINVPTAKPFIPPVTRQPHHTDFYRQFKGKLDVNVIQKELTAENYQEKFHHLLCWEEKEHERLLANRCDGEYTITLYQDEKEDEHVRYGIISGHNGDTVSYAKQASEGAFLILPETGEKRIYGEFVFAHSPTGEGIPFSLSREEAQNLTRLKREAKQSCKFSAYVEFQLKHSYFKRLHDAIQNVPKAVIARIMPTKTSFTKPSQHIIAKKPEYSELELDKTGQLQALDAILMSQSNAPLLVAGPFGTGKTRLLARVAYQILRFNRRARVLVCAHHQASVDTFIEYFGQMKKAGWRISLVRIIPNNGYHSKTCDKYRMWYKRKHEIRNVNSVNLIVTTLGMTLHLKGHFTHILMDEGAQTREPEAIAPLCLATEQTRIVIAGDHYQVGPKLLVLGKEAQDNGLGVSLLERLHKHYEDLGNITKNHCITLLSNYRCHSGILTLCSSLYYGSTLQCKVPESSSHPDAPYPLIFVCSTLDKIESVDSDTNETEARVLLEQVEKFINHWPECTWGQKDVRKVCIMTPSANQKSLIVQKKKSFKYKQLKEVEVLTAYDIQGREYRAIFIGTSEVTEKDGTPRNLTKSICDRYVFNTAISRAQSLVVCVGNPFMLLQSEKHMTVSTKYGDKGKCWSEYLRRCLEYQTFYPPPQALTVTEDCDAREVLMRKIFSSVDLHISSGENQTRKGEGDSIISAYYKEFEKIPECKRAKLLLFRRGKNLSWQIDESSMPSQTTHDDTSENLTFTDVYNCLLNIKHYRKAEAVPLDPSKKVVKINGLNNRRGAFNGDVVQVGVFSSGSEGKLCGKVIRIITESCPNRRFVCTVYRKNPTLFSPVDKKNPLISNLPPLSRDLLKRYNKDTINAELDSDIVVVFDPKSVESGMLPHIQHVIPLSVANRMLFVVQFIQWNLKYRLPLGMVVSAVPRGTSAFHAERLLKVQHGIEYNDENDSGPEPITDSERDKSLPLHDRAFTIDPEGAKNLDDAVSLQLLDSNGDNSEQHYEVSVHIVNAAKHIECGCELDSDAKLRGISAYGGESKTMHMLPRQFSKHLSLLPHCVRDTLSVCGIVTIVNDTVKSVRIQGKTIQQTQIKSSLQLTYKTAQAIMESSSEIPSELSQDIDLFNSSKDQPNLTTTLQLLYRVALFLRLQRLSASPAAYSYDINEPEERACWQAHLLIEELMIWANSVVAHTLYHSFEDCALLRRHAAPNREEQSAVIGQHSMVMGYSLYLQQFVSNFQKSLPIVVPHSTLQEILRAIESQNQPLLVNLLTSDNLYPQFAVARAQLQSTLHSAEYCCTSSEHASSDYKHHGLSLNFYTHFSSPLRRYFDIQVQRLALSFLSNSSTGIEPVFDKQLHQNLCQLLNTRSANAKQFDRGMRKLGLALKYTASSEVYSAVISCINKGTLELIFPDVEMKVLSHREKSCQVRHLHARKVHKDTSTYSWKIKMTSFENPAHILSTPELMNLKKQVVCRESTKGTIQHHSDPTIRLEIMQSDDTLRHLEAISYLAEGAPFAVSVQPTQWERVLKFAQNPTEAGLKELKKVFISLSTPLTATKTEQVKPFSFMLYHMTRTLTQYDIVKVWMTWSSREALLKPSLQLIELAPQIRICVQHNTHPAECFSDPILSNASKKRYNNIHEYVQLWEKVLLAEAAEKSTGEGDPVIIHDVKLDWPKLIPPQNCMDELYYEPSEGVRMELSEDFIEHSSEFFRIRVGDMVCIRYGTHAKSEVRAVFHMIIKKDSDRDTTQSKIMHMIPIGKNNCRISERLKNVLESKKERCEMQIVTMSSAYQRVYNNLIRLVQRKTLPSDTISARISTLVHQVALGNITKKLVKYGKEACEIFRRDKLARTLWSNGKMLNCVQIQAVELALRNNFQLIQGPPGTGKSETGAHIAYVFALLNRQLNQQSHRGSGQCVIYCGPSNKAVDVVLEKLHKLHKDHSEKRLRILRIYGRAVERKVYPGPYRNQEAFPRQESGYQYETFMEEYALHHKIRHSGSEASATLVELEKQFRDLPKECIATSSTCRKYKNALSEAEAEILTQMFDIILCTCNEASSQRVKRYIFPRQCIIDECGMAYEPEAIAPICLCDHVVLIGDHKQLQPVIEYPPAKEHGLGTSLFQRYAQHFTAYCKTLTIQYRMHEKICAFPSENFYDGQLETDVSVHNRRVDDRLKEFWPKGLEIPILFCDIIGEEDHLQHTTSKCNIQEARKVVELARVLHHIYKIDTSRMAILTPYSAQKEEIRKLAIQAKLLSSDQSKGLKVASITESQGDEYDIVLLSTVRSQPLSEIANPLQVQPDRGWLLENLGFLTDEHEINVGITRSKIGLIIVGNAKLLEYDDTWKALLAHYREKGCIVKHSFFPSKALQQKLPPL